MSFSLQSRHLQVIMLVIGSAQLCCPQCLCHALAIRDFDASASSISVPCVHLPWLNWFQIFRELLAKLHLHRIKLLCAPQKHLGPVLNSKHVVDISAASLWLQACVSSMTWWTQRLVRIVSDRVPLVLYVQHFVFSMINPKSNLYYFKVLCNYAFLYFYFTI